MTVATETRRWTKTEASLLIGFCLLSALLSFHVMVDEDTQPPSPFSSRRSLKAVKSKRYRPRRSRRASAIKEQSSFASIIAPSGIYSWAENNLKLLSETLDPSNEVPLFWHIPKSGGTTVESIYQCIGVTLANREGSLPQFGHDRDTELVSFRPWPNVNAAQYVNVDTTSKAGILQAEEWGLVPSGLVDLIFTSEPSFAIEHLYDEKHKGRVLGLFRHPVDRLVSKFYYLQVATWERTYQPDWKQISVLEFAQKKNNDNNHMVKKLAGKRMSEWVGEDDLQVAMRTIEERFVVGLMEEFEESIHRFNIVMGIDESVEKNNKCMDKFFGHGVEKKNSITHPTLEKEDPAWEVLAKENELDIRLYNHILELFDKQKLIIESYTNSVTLRQE